MPNILSGSSSASSPAQVSVGVASTSLAAANYDRVGLAVVNISTGTIYLGIGNAAEVGKGITLIANGGAWSMDEYSYTKETINAIAHAANSAVAVQEFVNRS